MVSMNHASKVRDVLQPDLKIFVKDVRDRQGRKRPLSVRSWSTIKDVKDKLQQLLHVPPSAQRLYFGPLLVAGKELPNHRTLNDAGIYRSGETLLLDIVGAAIDDQASITSLRSPTVSDICVSSSMLDATPKALRRVVQQARRGLALGFKPELVMDGSGGTYILHDARKGNVAVYKPGDEEPYAENNPRGYVPQGAGFGDGEEAVDMSLRAGIRPGELCLREVAAYLLDHKGFSSVPMTTLAEARHPAFNTNGAMLKLAEGGASMGAHSLIVSNPGTAILMKKVGSCQEFVHAECTMDDLSPSKIDVDEVHKIAILDIRLMNADRNAANLLCRRKPDDSLELVPIDHGYCLRSVADVAWFDWCWLDWPQLKQPLSKKSKDYILNLDVEADARLLKERLHIGDEALDYFRASSKLLQVGVKAGLRLYDIALMCSRQDGAGLVPCKLEAIYSQATELATCAVENGKWHHAAASRALAEQIAVYGPNSQKLSSAIKLSQSSVNFSDLFGEKGHDLAHLPSAMATSGSDSSSDAGDQGLEQEECEEWAAAVIADVHIENETSLSHRERSSSFDSEMSDDSSKLSTSPSGFWLVRPGSDKVNDDDSWSSTSSQRPSFTKETLVNESTKSIITFDAEDEFSSRPLQQSPLTKQTAVNENSESVATTFHPGELHSQSSTDFLRSTIHSVSSSRSYARGLVRSQSYSSFSKVNELSSPSFANVRAGRAISDASDKHRLYFLKFVDLLIERETIVASR